MVSEAQRLQSQEFNFQSFGPARNRAYPQVGSAYDHHPGDIEGYATGYATGWHMAESEGSRPKPTAPVNFPRARNHTLLGWRDQPELALNIRFFQIEIYRDMRYEILWDDMLNIVWTCLKLYIFLKETQNTSYFGFAGVKSPFTAKTNQLAARTFLSTKGTSRSENRKQSAGIKQTWKYIRSKADLKAIWTHRASVSTTPTRV